MVADYNRTHYFAVASLDAERRTAFTHYTLVELHEHLVAIGARRVTVRKMRGERVLSAPEPYPTIPTLTRLRADIRRAQRPG